MRTPATCTATSAELDGGSRRRDPPRCSGPGWRGTRCGAGRDGAALALAWLARAQLDGAVALPAYLTPVLVGVGLAAALSGALRTAGRGGGCAWLGVGLAAGVVLAVGGDGDEGAGTRAAAAPGRPGRRGATSG